MDLPQVVIPVIIYDIVMAGHDARVYNREHAVHLAPMMTSSSGHRTTGLVLEGRF